MSDTPTGRPIFDIDPSALRAIGETRTQIFSSGSFNQVSPRTDSIPTSVRVGAVTYEVQSDDSTPRELSRRDSEHKESLGYSDNHEQLMLVHPEQGEDQKRVTLLHEVLHALWFASGLGESAAKEHEELVLTSLDDALSDVLQRNPELVRYLVP